MGSCAAPSAKGDDKFITTDYLQQCRHENTVSLAYDFFRILRFPLKYLPMDLNLAAATSSK
ncbi:hypothetical protein DBP88_01355 (plasmid) [Enterobacter hormaechei]|nr:hypothetical protein DBP88_01355 [Enterobacter hormaechei]ECH1095374.1 hypothetical protein [Salmonella enterica subsp. enterica serovar Schwarzengrund]